MTVLQSALLVGTLLLQFVAPQRYIDEFSRRQDGGNGISGVRWAGSTRGRSSGSSRRSGNGFNLGRTPDGEVGYIGINGGENGMPWMGGSGAGELHSDGGARLGRGSGVGSGSIWAYRQRVEMGIDDHFPHMTGPPPSEVLGNRGRSGRTGTRRRTNSRSRTGGSSMIRGRPRHSVSSSDRIHRPRGGGRSSEMIHRPHGGGRSSDRIQRTQDGGRFGGRPMPMFPSGFGMFPPMMPFRQFRF